MKEKIWRDVFSLQSNVGLHKTEGDSYLFFESQLTTKTQFTDVSVSMTRINRSAAEILNACDGTTSIEDIVNHLQSCYPDSPQNDIYQHVIDCLHNAEQLHYVTQDPLVVIGERTGNFSGYYPMHAVIELTDGCNLSCPHCYREARRKNYTLAPTLELLEGLHRLREHGVRVVEFTGGEPTLHPDFLVIVNEALQLFSTVGIISNGTLLRPEDIQQFKAPQKLVVQVDLDGPTAPVHRQIHGGNRRLDTFTPVLAAIRECVKRQIFVRIAVNVSPLNLDTVEETVDFGIQTGVSMIGISPVSPMGRAKHNPTMAFSPAQIVQLETLIHRLSHKYPGRLNMLDETTIRRQSDNCGVGYRTITIAPDGAIRPCVTTLNTEQLPTLGNLHRDPYDTIFSSSVVNALATLIAPNPDTCQSCTYESYCRHCIAHGLETKIGHRCAWKERYASQLKMLMT